MFRAVAVLQRHKREPWLDVPHERALLLHITPFLRGARGESSLKRPGESIGIAQLARDFRRPGRCGHRDKITRKCGEARWHERVAVGSLLQAAYGITNVVLPRMMICAVQQQLERHG